MIAIALQILGLVVVLEGFLLGLSRDGEKAMMLELACAAAGLVLFVVGRRLGAKRGAR